eukprot:gene21264-21194_t
MVIEADPDFIQDGLRPVAYEFNNGKRNAMSYRDRNMFTLNTPVMTENGLFNSRGELDAANEALCKLIGEKLNNEFPGHPWVVRSEIEHGIVKIEMQGFAQWPMTIKVANLKGDSSMALVKRYAGELLERLNLPRAGFSLDDWRSAVHKRPWHFFRNAQAPMEEWDTSNNREAEGGSFTRGKVDISESFMSDAADMEQENPAENAAEQGEEENLFPLDSAQLMRLVKSAFSQGSSYLETTLQPRWTSAYNSFNNKHAGDSKYSTPRFRGRSRLYRPKTRSTARKKQAEAAAALFSTSDAVLVKAMDESNPEQAAGAEVLGQLLRFRLDRANENSGIPWFQIAMGAHLSAQQTAICISKQYWEYRKELVAYEDVPVMVDIPPELQPMVGA